MHAVGGVQYQTHLRILQNFLREETLAEHEVCVWQVGKGLQQNLHDDLQVAVGRVELVQFQEGQVSLQIVRLLPGLGVHEKM